MTDRKTPERTRCFRDVDLILTDLCVEVRDAAFTSGIRNARLAASDKIDGIISDFLRDMPEDPVLPPDPNDEYIERIRELEAEVADLQCVHSRSLSWEPDTQHYAGHVIARTSVGTYIAGPRRSDGAWEYCTPDDEGDFGFHNHHHIDDLSEQEAKNACFLHFVCKVFEPSGCAMDFRNTVCVEKPRGTGDA